jgi:hypothetical protein
VEIRPCNKQTPRQIYNALFILKSFIGNGLVDVSSVANNEVNAYEVRVLCGDCLQITDVERTA